MVVNINSRFKSHRNPVWRTDANFLIHAEISLNGEFWGYEQLWVRRVDTNEFVVCCIPFFVYNIGLGDLVSTGQSEKYYFENIVNKSGNITVRLRSQEDKVYRRLIELLEVDDFLFEIATESLIAASFPSLEVFSDFIKKHMIDLTDIKYEIAN